MESFDVEQQAEKTDRVFLTLLVNLDISQLWSQTHVDLQE